MTLNQLIKHLKEMEHESGGDQEVAFDLWTRDDLADEYPSSTDEQRDQVLAAMQHHHDANIGLNWDRLHDEADRAGLNDPPKLPSPGTHCDHDE